MIKYIPMAIKGKELFPLKWRKLMDLLYSKKVKRIAKKLRSGTLSYNEAYQLKRYLPAVHWMLDTDAEVRKGLTGTFNGLACIDIDHMEGDVRKLYEQVIAPRLEELKIVFVQKSISGHGLHIGFVKHPELVTIAGNQFWMAKQLGLEDFDRVCCDTERCWFVSPRKDWLYINKPVLKQLLRDGSLKMG